MPDALHGISPTLDQVPTPEPIGTLEAAALPRIAEPSKPPAPNARRRVRGSPDAPARLELATYGLEVVYLQGNSSVYGPFDALRCAELRSDFASSGHFRRASRFRPVRQPSAAPHQAWGKEAAGAGSSATAA
jgi:hypothetical protein